MFIRSVFHHRQFRYLGAFYSHSVIRLFAISIFQLFNGIYVFQLASGLGFNFSQSLAIAAIFFALLNSFQALSTVPALWLISRRGLRSAVFWGNFLLIFYLFFLIMAKYDAILLIFATLIGGFSIGFYWTAYHIYFAELSDDKKQGEELSIGNLLAALAAVGGPAFGGIIISYWGFQTALLVMSLLVVVAIFPLKYLPKTEDRVAVHIIPTVRAISPKKEWKSFAAFLGAGVSETVEHVFWPIYVFPILSGFVGVGLMGSIISLTAVFATIGIGFLIDKVGARRILNFSSPLDSLIWVLMSLVTIPFHVFSVVALQAFTKLGMNMALDSILYTRARHQDIVAFIFQRELALSVGRGSLLFLIGFLFWFGMPLVIILLVAALTSLLTRLYPKSN